MKGQLYFIKELGSYDKCVLDLLNTLLNIKQTKFIPKIKIYNTENIFDAIKGKNYELALDLVNERNRNYNITEYNSIDYLLNDIVNEIKKINSTNKDVQQREEKNNNVEKKEDKVINEKNISSVNYTNIIKYLMNNDLDNTFRVLKNYLESINKSEYEFLIVDLIKLSILEKDIAFTKPMIALTFISRENYTFDIANYIQEFYINLSQNKFEEARIYLDIISKGNKLGQECIITDGLYQILESSEKMVDYMKDNNDLEMPEKSIDDNKKDNVIEEIEEESYVEPTKKVTKNEDLIKSEEEPIIKEEKPKIIHNVVDKDHDNELVSRSYQSLLENKGIILLKVMKRERIDNILRIVKEYPDVVAFVIGNDNNQQIVLRYKPKINEHIEFIDIFKKCDTAYKEKKYDECIEYDLELLEHMNYPKSRLYFNLGMAYLKKYQIELAIDYLTVANDLAKKENTGRDYGDLILSLKGEIDNKDKKNHFRMAEDEFRYKDIGDYYGIDNFIEINNYIIESNLDVESACEKFGLDKEKIDIIKLIYAREYYRQADYKNGDKFLKSVERSKNKTSETKKIFEEVRKNRLFYHNRQSSNSLKLKLSLVPNKK